MDNIREYIDLLGKLYLQNHRCFKKREGSLVKCDVYKFENNSCVHIDLKSPGGLISCFTEGNNSRVIKKEYLVDLDSKYCTKRLPYLSNNFIHHSFKT